MVMSPQLKNPKFYLMIFSDIILFAVSLCLAYLMRHEFNFGMDDIQQITGLLVWIIPLKFLIYLFSGLYSGMWRFTGVRDFWLLAKASVIATMLIALIILFGNRFEGYSRSIFIADGVLTFILTGGIRMAIRFFYSLRVRAGMDNDVLPGVRSMKVLIIGAGQAGEKILREIMENYNLNFDVAGFIDDDPQKQGLTIHGVRVLGNLSRLPAIINHERIQQIFIAVPSASSDEIRRIVDACRKSNTSYKILPGIGDLIDGRVSVKLLRDISYEDLLGRPPVELDTRGIRSYLDGKVVLVTGCGGSIGSELCRQIVKYQPGRLILLDSGEHNLFNIQMEMQYEQYYQHFEPVLARVQDKSLMDNVFEKYKPDVVFHAAAYKHVPMMEKNPWQAVYNNIIGSQVMMEMAVKHHADRFVLVSTDKAVRPTNVMGASKRVTELMMQCHLGNGTKFMAVRFGNVVGSSGSVIPFFRRQIEHGGPVTVTHPEVNRFFMTIPEASQMILQAGMMGEGGEIFVLRMGTPVKIADMARDLIRLSGKEPDVDIKIVYTGLREGEKLYEELITEGEDILPTGHKKIMVLRSNGHFKGSANRQEAKQNLYRDIDELVEIASRQDAKGIKAKLKEMVPEFTPQENESVL